MEVQEGKKGAGGDRWPGGFKGYGESGGMHTWEKLSEWVLWTEEAVTVSVEERAAGGGCHWSNTGYCVRRQYN